MQEMSKPYAKTAMPPHYNLGESQRQPRFSPANVTLFQKILLANLFIVMAGAIIGTCLTAQLAEAGQFNAFTFGIIIGTSVTFSGLINLILLKFAFRPFDELQKVLDKIHTGNSHARASLRRITDPDVRQFTTALNQMLSRLEENAKVIQEDQRQLQLMTARVINAQENERKRIARELHDEASQALTAMIMGLESARQDVDPDDKMLHVKFDGLKQLAAGTLEELRKLALDLRPTMLDDLGLLPALRWLSRTAAERAGIKTSVKITGFEDSERLAPELETCLFRITQECLTNITRHAAATQVEIRLERVDNELDSAAVRLSVSDDGCGFRPAEAKQAAYQGGHLGLFDIEERAALLGGKVQIESQLIGESKNAASGTKISVLLPLSGCPVEPDCYINTHAAPYTK